MLASQIQTVQEFALAGRFQPITLMVAGAALVGITLALTWWELRRNRPRLVPVLVVLRAAALAVVLWMLAEPVTRTTVRRTQLKSVAILADTSDSMGVVDPGQDQAEVVRWTAMQEGSIQADVISGLDAAALGITMARDLFARSVESADRPEEIKAAREQMARAGKWAASADTQLRRCARLDIADGARRETLQKVHSTLSDHLVPTIQEFADDLAQNRLVADRSRSGRAEQLRQTMDQLVTQLKQLAAVCAADVSRQGEAGLREAVDRDSRLTRREKLSGFLQGVEKAAVGRMAKQADVLRYGFDSEVFSLGSRQWTTALSASRPDTGQRTDLNAPLAQIEQDSAGRALAAVVLLTDGAHNVDGDPAKRAAALTHSSVYVVPIGNTQPVRDVMIHHAQAPRSVFQNNLIVIGAMLDAQDCPGEQLQVELLENNEVVDRQTIVVTGNTFFTPLSFKRKAEQIGLNEYQIRVAAVVDERTKENNEASLRVEVTEGTVRVFLADQLPRWEFRYLRNLFKRDERIEFESLLLDPAGATGKPGQTVGIPDNVEAWNRYRVVILGDISAAYLSESHQEQLREYVSSRGGTLMLIAGDTAMPSAYMDGPLGAAMPIESAKNPLASDRSFYLAVTAEGRTTDVTQLADDAAASDQLWSEHVEVQHLSEYSLPKQTAHVWLAAMPGTVDSPAGTEMSAFLCWQQYGKGRVVYLAAPVTYRLRYRYGDLYHHRFWGQLLRWAISREIGTGSTTVRLITDKTHYQAGEDVPVTVRLSHPNGETVGKEKIDVAASGDGRRQAVVSAQEDADSPGVYRATLKGLPVGSVTIRPEGAAIQKLLSEEHYTEPVETTVVVEPPLSLELRNTRCNLPLLTQIASATGGAVIPPTALPAALEMLDLSPEVTEEVRQEALWPRWTYLALFIGCLGIEWLLRKLLGMA